LSDGVWLVSADDVVEAVWLVGADDVVEGVVTAADVVAAWRC
jgi:hypothetical protein